MGKIPLCLKQEICFLLVGSRYFIFLFLLKAPVLSQCNYLRLEMETTRVPFLLDAIFGNLRSSGAAWGKPMGCYVSVPVEVVFFFI